METQLDLSVRTPAPDVSVEEVALLVRVLGELKGWATAGDLAAHLGSGYNDRKVRAIAAAAMPQIVSFPGSPGYRLFQYCTVEELDRCINAFEAQGRDMLKRAVLYRQAYHKFYRGDPTKPNANVQGRSGEKPASPSVLQPQTPERSL